MNAYVTTSAASRLMRNLQQLAEEAEGRRRRITIRRRPGAAVRQWRGPLGIRTPIWWLGPVAWAAVFATGSMVFDPMLDVIDHYLATMGL